jgi:glutaminyl-tRNA synthetase
MPTIDGLRRRGYTPEAINNFVDRVGVTRRGNENIISISWLESSIRADLDAKAPRTMAVIDPLKVTLKNLDKEVELDTFLFPKQKEKGGVRKVVLSKTIFIERTDFKEEEDKDFFGLTPKQEVGLKYGGIIKVEEVKKDKNGKVIELICTYSSESKKTKGRIHWIGEKDFVQAEVRLYGYLFLSDDPFHANEEGASHDPMDDLNPNSLVTKMGALVHKDITKGLKHLDHFQFERVGYFVCDYDTQNEKGRYVFNLTVDLGDGKVDKMMEKESK